MHRYTDIHTLRGLSSFDCYVCVTEMLEIFSFRVLKTCFKLMHYNRLKSVSEGKLSYLKLGKKDGPF